MTSPDEITLDDVTGAARGRRRTAVYILLRRLNILRGSTHTVTDQNGISDRPEGKLRGKAEKIEQALTFHTLPTGHS